jgi:acyl-CoA reductase-like NAD-dependent aldehyde dehydrogenase
MTRYESFVNGEWQKAFDYRDNISPSDDRDVIGSFAISDTSMIDRAVSSARDALLPWSRTSPQLRASLLEAVAAELIGSAESIGEVLAREEGKTRREAVAEVLRAGQIFRFFSGEALRMTGERQQSTRVGVSVSLHREPVGVVGIITPWNFPLAIPAWKAAPALAYGNTVIMKPADLVPASAHMLARIIDKVGFPPGVFNLVTGPGSVLGDALSRHEGIDAITFTGSEAIGHRVAAGAVPNLTRVQLEMGGKNPLVVLADADLDIAVSAAIDGAFYATGQRCTASSRLIVEDAIHDVFVDRMRERMSELRVGNSLHDATDIGPVVDSRQLDVDLSYIDMARNTSGCTVFGGGVVEAETTGFFLAPALIVEARNSDPASREEIFGPVASVIRVADYEEAVDVANDTPFGLVAGICTTSLSHAEDFQSRADAGMVMVNLPTAGVDPHVSFGGRKRSSYGPHEQGTHARDFFTQTKTAYVRP